MQQAKWLMAKQQQQKNIKMLQSDRSWKVDVLDGCVASELRYNGQRILGSNRVTLRLPKVEPLLSGTSGKVQQAQTAVRGRWVISINTLK